MHPALLSALPPNSQKDYLMPLVGLPGALAVRFLSCTPTVSHVQPDNMHAPAAVLHANKGSERNVMTGFSTDAADASQVGHVWYCEWAGK